MSRMREMLEQEAGHQLEQQAGSGKTSSSKKKNKKNSSKGRKY